VRRPLVSIGLPVFNGEAYLDEAIRSVLAQSLADLELVISDNASTDRTAEICRDWAATDRRIRYFRNPENLGAAPNYNRTFAESCGRYFKWLAHDDRLRPEYLAATVAALEADPSVVLCNTTVAYIDASGAPLGVYRSPLGLAATERPSERFAALVLRSHSCVDFFGTIRRSALEGSLLHGPFHGADLALLAQLALRGRMVQLEPPLVEMREHPDCCTRSRRSSAERQRWHLEGATRRPQPSLELWRTYRGLIETEPLTARERRACRRVLARWWFVNWNIFRLAVDLVDRVAPGTIACAEDLKIRLFGAAPGHFVQLAEAPRAAPTRQPVTVRADPHGLGARFEDCAPIFVVGAPRSGTSLLARVLDAHPAIGLADELCFFDIVLSARWEVPELDSPERIARFLELLPRMDHVRYWADGEALIAAAAERLRADPAPSYAHCYRHLMEARAAAVGARRFGEKTPWNVRHLEALEALFPNARFVHIVRDPRAVVASKRKLPRTSTDFVTNAVKWSIDVAAAARYRESSPERTARLLEIRYEDLVRNPEAVHRRVAAFLGEPFDPAMLAFNEVGTPAFGNQPWRDGVRRPLFDSSLASWRNEFTPAQLWLIQRLTRAEMARYGYTPEPIPVRQRLVLPLQVLREFAAWLAFKRAERPLARRRTWYRFPGRSAATLQALGADHPQRPGFGRLSLTRSGEGSVPLPTARRPRAARWRTGRAKVRRPSR